MWRILRFLFPIPGAVPKRTPRSVISIPKRVPIPIPIPGRRRRGVLQTQKLHRQRLSQRRPNLRASLNRPHQHGDVDRCVMATPHGVFVVGGLVQRTSKVTFQTRVRNRGLVKLRKSVFFFVATFSVVPKKQIGRFANPQTPTPHHLVVFPHRVPQLGAPELLRDLLFRQQSAGYRRPRGSFLFQIMRERARVVQTGRRAFSEPRAAHELRVRLDAFLDTSRGPSGDGAEGFEQGFFDGCRKIVGNGFGNRL
mmetsp:Transcript_1998/g.7717  ORF Transcript_1998/g.7717 Transcript_1998/m.7717 type:complete len:252 (-) Transcript_1998:578-1333(-)